MARIREWWPAASREQKLTQVKAAVEMGLTSGETAILLGTTRGAVAVFAAREPGLSFRKSDSSHASRRKAAAARRLTSQRARYGDEFDNLAFAEKLDREVSPEATMIDDGYSILGLDQ